MASEGITMQWLLEACGASSVDQVRSVNLWAKGLSSAQIHDTVAACPHLEVASLSNNSIDQLAPFRRNKKLQELFLRKNKVADILEVGHLAGLPLRVLWLSDNPCEKHELYRPLVVRLCPNLVKLDKKDVTAEERAACAKGVHSALDSLVQQAIGFAAEAGVAEAGGIPAAAAVAATAAAAASPTRPSRPTTHPAQAAALAAVLALLPSLTPAGLAEVREVAGKLAQG